MIIGVCNADGGTGDGYDDAMTLNTDGAIHAFLTSYFFNGRDYNPAGTSIPYGQVMLADVNAGTLDAAELIFR